MHTPLTTSVCFFSARIKFFLLSIIAMYGTFMLQYVQ